MATIQLTLRHNPLAFLLMFVKPRVEVDGTAHTANWGSFSVEVGPGDHAVAVYFPYFNKKRCGTATANVTVGESQTQRLDYKAPQIMTSPGKLALT